MLFFDKEMDLKGRHAVRIQDFKVAKCINSYIDLIPAAAVLGFKYGRKPEVDRSIEKIANIPSDVMRRHNDKLYLTYCLIMLNTASEESFHDRAERLFKSTTLEYKADFEAYIRGGIDYLYEVLFEGCHDETERSKRIFELFNENLAMTNGQEGILKLVAALKEE